MTILAVEFSSEQRSVALVEGNAESRVLGEARETGGRNAHAFALIESVLQQAQVEREKIDVVAVGLGPGSYTGIRAAIALAQGWQLARDIQLIGVSSVDCLAAQACELGFRGVVNVIVDAQRTEFYMATYEISEGHWKNVEPLRIVPLVEVETRLAQKQTVIGPEAARHLAGATELFAEAAMLGKIAAVKTEFIAGEKLEPIYLRETSFVKAPPLREI